MAKSSYIGMTRSLATEGAKCGIKVNLVSPAGATRMSENMADGELKDWLLRTARVDLVSPLVALLCHDDCPASGELFYQGSKMLTHPRLEMLNHGATGLTNAR